MLPSPGLEAGRAFSFGPFSLQKAQKQLTEDGVAVRVGRRAMELLLVLVENPGEVMSREQLISRVWQCTVVEETSLRVHIAGLRKALRDGIDGARYITNIPGRGYCFVAPVNVQSDTQLPAEAIAIANHCAYNSLPSRAIRVVGRPETTQALGEHLRARRLVSIMGSGGIGKTTVALATAAEHMANYEHGVVFVDFAPLNVPDLVPSTVALALGSQPTSESLLPQIGEFLRDRRMLLVLDNCEHVAGAVALLVESVMRAAPDVHILTTTREPLFAEGEWVYRLSALNAPGSDDELTLEQAMSYSAIRLFVERADANPGGFVLSSETLPAVRRLCQRLDGIPLAIELAAARAGSLGMVALAEDLDELFQLLNRSRRTQMQRHQTLDALLDWSFDLLTASEQLVLRRLSVFRSSFSLQTAKAIAVSEGIDATTVVECLSSLVLKSLVNVDTSGASSQFRLLYMTRAYAACKLADSGEMRTLQRRHAEHFLEVARTAADRWGATAVDRLAIFGPLIDDLRSALDWAFSPDGDTLVGVELTAGGWVATVGLGLFSEYRARVDHALECAKLLSSPQPKLELALCVCWCFLSGQTPGMGGAQQTGMFERARSLAVQVADVELHAEALYAISVGALGQGRYTIVRQLMDELKSLVNGDNEPLSVLVGDRLLALVHHHLGNHALARTLTKKVLRYRAEDRHAWFIGQVPRSVSMVIVEARILWLEGASDQASEAARLAVGSAIGEHPFALSQALALAAIPIALWRGDHDQARDLVRALHEHANRHSLAYWQSWADGYARIIDQGVDGPLEAVIGEPGGIRNTLELDMFATFSHKLLSRVAIDRVNSGMVGWCGPELLRAQAVRLLQGQNDACAEHAEALLVRGLDMAREQGALAWELRIATSLAEFWLRSRTAQAHALLSEILGRFTEGLGTRDVVLGRCALEELDAALFRLAVSVATQ